MVESTLYLDHFELNQPPFRQEPDPRIFFQGAGHPHVLHSILGNVHEGKPLIKLTGNEGVGKTLLSLLLTRRLPAETFDIVILDRPSGSYEDLLRIICLALSPEKNGNSIPRQYLRECRELLHLKKNQQKKVLLIIDEAEKIFLATLERLVKMICDTDFSEVLQILLIGRLELDHNLDQLKIYCSNVDIHAGYVLEPLDEDQTKEYLQYRLKSAGIPGQKHLTVFGDEVAHAIYQAAGGNIRRTNTLAEKGLREACARGISMVEPEMITPGQPMIKNDYSAFLKVRDLFVRNTWWTAGGAIVLFVFIIIFFAGKGDEKKSDLGNQGFREEIVIEKPEIVIPAEKNIPAEKEFAARMKQPEPAAPLIDDTGKDQQTSETHKVRKAEVPGEPVQPESTPPLPPVSKNETNKIALRPVDVPERDESREVLKPRESKKKMEPAANGLIVVEARSRKKKMESMPESAIQPDVASSQDSTQLFNERLKATSNWLAWSYRGGYTIQLMMLTADDAEENLKNMLGQEEYSPVRDDMYIIKRNSPPALFVYYGMYDTLEEARQARNNLPPFLRGHQPYALSITEALNKTRE